MTLDLPPIPTWTQRAACVGHDPEWWHPSIGNQSANTATAIAICRTCPVQKPCLALALKYEATELSGRNRHGIYGGLLPGERARIDRTGAA